jgi:hypothetical protein
MLPIQSAHRKRNGRAAHSEATSNLADADTIMPKFAHPADFLFGQFGEAVPFAALDSILSHHVGHIIGRRAEE